MDGKKMSKSQGQPHRAAEVLRRRRRRRAAALPPVRRAARRRRSTGPTRPTSVIEGCRRFLDRVWRLATASPPPTRDGALSDADVALRRAVHRAIPRSPTTSNGGASTRRSPRHASCRTRSPRSVDRASGGAHATSSTRRSTSCASLLAPMTPHVTAELWSRRHPDRRPRAPDCVADRGPVAARPSRPRRSSSRSTAR